MELDKKIRKILADYLGIKESDITLEMDLVKDLNVNSYDIMSIVGRFEDEFDIEIPDNDIRLFKTVKDVVDYVEKQK